MTIRNIEIRPGGVTLAVEDLSDIFPQMADLFTDHHEEVDRDRDLIKLNPDMVKYKVMEDAGKLLICTVRKDTELVGYSLYFIDEHVHYADDLFAVNDIIYIDPKHRKGGLAITLLAFCELRLRELEVSVTSIHMKTYASFDKLLEMAGYEFTEKVFTKILKE